MYWKIYLILVAGSCFCISSAAYICVKIALRPKNNGDWEQTHWDVEDNHPELARYNFWCRLFFIAIIISMLLLFLSISI